MAAAGQLDGWRDGGLAELRRAFAPFDSVGDVYARPALNARTPSRLHAIEELPVAVGLLVATGGDYEETVLGGVNYGRDSDSIASMGGALAGALGNPVRRDWVEDVSTASKIDVEAAGGRWPRSRSRSSRATRASRSACPRDRRSHGRRGSRLRLTWVQPEDLVGHELRQAREEGKEIDAVERRWLEAGGRPAPSRGASQEPVGPELRLLAFELLDELAAMPRPLADAEPEGFDEILAEASPAPPIEPRDLASRIAGAWLGRAVGCVLGKPVENVPREGIRAIAQATGNWPVSGWFTAEGLPNDVAEQWPWNRASRSTSLAENINGIPEDDDLNFTILGLALLER